MEAWIESGVHVFFADYEDRIQRGTVLRSADEMMPEDSEVLVEVDPTFNRSKYNTYYVARWRMQPATERGLARLKNELVDFLERCSRPHKDAVIALNNKIISVKSTHINHSVQ